MRIIMLFILMLFSFACGFSAPQDELFTAVDKGDLAAVSNLLARGASVNARDRHGRPFIIHAAAQNDPDLMRLVLQKRPDLGAKNKSDGRTALHSAVMNPDTVILRLLLDAGAPQNSRDENGQTPFLYAAFYGRLEALKILAERGANIRDTDFGGSSALILACVYPHADTAGTVQYLVSRGLDVNAVSKKGNTPLILSITADKTNAAVTLLDAGAYPDKADKDGNTPLHSAARGGNDVVMKALLIKKPLLDPVLGYQFGEKTPLEEALFWRRTNCALMLIHAGANPDCLSTALFAELPDIALLLIEKGAPVNVDTNWKQTPLMQASVSGYTRVVRAMLEKGADAGQTGEFFNITGLKAIDLAWAMDYPEIVKLLELKGQRVNKKLALEYKEKLEKPWMDR